MDSDLARRICETSAPFLMAASKKIVEEEVKVFYGRNKMSDERAMEMRPVGKRVLLEKDDAPETSGSKSSGKLSRQIQLLASHPHCQHKSSYRGSS